MSSHIVWVTWTELHKPYVGCETPVPILKAHPVHTERHTEAEHTAGKIREDTALWLYQHNFDPAVADDVDVHVQAAKSCQTCDKHHDRRLQRLDAL